MKIILKSFILFFGLYINDVNCRSKRCILSETTISGMSIQNDQELCSGDLIFEDDFESLDFSKWKHEVTLGGGGNWEFQWYTNNRTNSFVENGVLHIRPTLTADVLGEHFLSSGTLNIQEDCTNPKWWGCERTGTPINILNPIRSARLQTKSTFNFKYGKVEVRAKLPSGDWLWPAIWLMPKHNAYGIWPSSGEIDMAESRGNKNLVKNGKNIGVEQVESTIHFGPYPQLIAHEQVTRNSPPGQGYINDFHRYQMEWTPNKITFSIDDEETGTISADEGMWVRGHFDRNSHLDNPWKQGTLMAPFDKEFYIILNLAVGGINFFPDDAQNPSGKPWANNSPKAATDFWNGRNSWLPTWNLNRQNGYDSSLLVDYVRVYAI